MRIACIDLMGTYDFDVDYERSRPNVEFVSRVLEEAYPQARIVNRDNADAEWQRINGDVMILREADGALMGRIECKEDLRGKDTGNVAVEYWSRGSKSGIAKSQSEFWVYTVHTHEGREVLLMHREDLWSLMQAKAFKRTICGGDPDSGTWMALFARDVIRDISKVIYTGK